MLKIKQLNKKYYFFLSFFTGFLIDYFLYVLMRIFSTKLPFTLFLPLVIILGFAGVAQGVVLSQNEIFKEKFFKFFPVLFFVLLVSVIYNQNVPFVFILPNPAFPVPRPTYYILHLLFFILAFLLLSLTFVLPGYFFCKVLKKTENIFVFYAVHLGGFLAGGITAYYLILILGAYIALILGCILLLFFLPDLVIKIILFFILLGFIFISKNKKDNFFLWEIKNYKKLNTFWSPYYKLDFLSFNKDNCLAAIYNDFMIYYVCRDYKLDHFQRRVIFEKIAQNKTSALVIGGSGGTSTMDIWYANKKIKRIDALEIDPVVVKMMNFDKGFCSLKNFYTKNNFNKKEDNSYIWYNNNIFNKKGIKEIAGEGRVFINKTKNKYDLIFYDGLDNRLLTHLKTIVSVESYLFTKEAYQKIFNKVLTENGLLTIDVGGTIKEEIYPFIASFPEDVHRKVYWYIVSDYPMVGLPLFFVVASKSKKEIDKVSKELKNISSLKEVKIPEKLPQLNITDDHPFVYTQTIFLFILLFFFILPFLLIIFYYVHKHSIKKEFLNKKYFLLTGLNFGMLESFLLSRNSRVFPDPAFSSLILLLSFISGNVLINFYFSKIKKINILKFGYGCLLVLVLVLINVPKDTEVIFLTFIGGFFSGFFWPVGLSFTEKESRDLAFGYDYLGSILGVVLIQVFLFKFGYFQTAFFIILGYIWLLNLLVKTLTYFSLVKIFNNFFKLLK